MTEPRYVGEPAPRKETFTVGVVGGKITDPSFPLLRDCSRLDFSLSTFWRRSACWRNMLAERWAGSPCGSLWSSGGQYSALLLTVPHFLLSHFPVFPDLHHSGLPIRQQALVLALGFAFIDDLGCGRGKEIRELKWAHSFTLSLRAWWVAAECWGFAGFWGHDNG